MQTLNDGGRVDEVAPTENTHDVWVQIRYFQLGAVVHPGEFALSTTATLFITVLLQPSVDTTLHVNKERHQRMINICVVGRCEIITN